MTGVQLVARSDRGRVRERNEDSVAVDPHRGIAALADGMGGLRDGHVASREAVAAAIDHLSGLVDDGPLAVSPGSAVAAAVAAANRRVRSLAAGDGVMGTTLEVLLVTPSGHCTLAHVGDSRAYCLRRGRLELLTRDHSLVQDLVDDGQLRPEQARRALNRNIITRAVGLADTVDPDGVVVDLDAGDVLLLCSDGLWDMLADDDLRRLLDDCRPEPAGLDACADRLVAAANAAGGADNVSLILARPEAPGTR